MKRITFTIPWPLTGLETRDVLSFCFQTSLVSYLLFLLLENVQPGFVTAYIDMQWWLWATIISGAASAVWPFIVPEAQWQKKKLGWREYLSIGLVAIGATVIIWYKISDLGAIGGGIAILSGALVASLGVMVWYDRDDAHQ